MEESKKKTVMMGLTGVCLVLAGVIAYMNLPHDTGIAAIKLGDKMLVKCSNPDCAASYEIEKRDYFDYVQKHANPSEMRVPAMVCQKCGKESVYRAEKCQKCGSIFFYGETNENFPDTCPECGYSEVQEVRKKAVN